MHLRPHARALLIYATLCISALAWLGLIGAAPWLAANRQFTLSLLLYRSFSAVCHQMPERSFHLLGYPLGVCARCTGIYAGFVLGLIVYPLARRVEQEVMPARWWIVAAAVPAVIDFAGGALGLLTNTFFSRAATGLVAGAAAAFYLVPGLVSMRFRVRRPKSFDSELPT